MLRQNGRDAKISALDPEYARRLRRLEPETDPAIVRGREGEHISSRFLTAHIKKERSSAYWFAATKWGIMGLVAGILIGGGGMYFASMATLDTAQMAVSKGALIESLRREREERQKAPPVEPAP